VPCVLSEKSGKGKSLKRLLSGRSTTEGFPASEREGKGLPSPKKGGGCQKYCRESAVLANLGGGEEFDGKDTEGERRVTTLRVKKDGPRVHQNGEHWGAARSY